MKETKSCTSENVPAKAHAIAQARRELESIGKPLYNPLEEGLSVPYTSCYTVPEISMLRQHILLPKVFAPLLNDGTVRAACHSNSVTIHLAHRYREL